MAISPEFKSSSPELKPRVARSSVPEHDLPPRASADYQAQRHLPDRNSSGSTVYIWGLIVLAVAGYLAYSYYSPTTLDPTASYQNSKTLAPLATPTPSATVPDVPATQPETKTTP